MRNHILHIGYHPSQYQFLSDVNQYIYKFGNEDDRNDICSLMLSASDGYHVMFPDKEKIKWLRDGIILGLEYLTGVPLGFIIPEEKVDLGDVIKSDYNENIITASNNELDNNLHVVLHVPVMSSDCYQFIEHVYQSIPDNLNEHIKVHCIAYASNFFSNEPCDESQCRGRLNELKEMMEARQVSCDSRFFYISNYDERGRCLQLNEESELARFVARLLLFISNDYNALSITRANNKHITSVGVYGREIDKYSEINNHFANLMKSLLTRFIGLNEETGEISLDKVDDFINEDYKLLHQYYESDSNDSREETNKKLQESLQKILNSKDLTLNEKSELLNNLRQLWDKDLDSIENTPHKTFEDIYIPLIEASGLETPYPAVKELISQIKQQKKSIEAHEKKIEKLSKQLPEFQQNCYWTEDGFRVGDTVQRVEDKPLDSSDSITDITDYIPTNSELLKSVDISSRFPKIKSQGRQGACVSFSLVSIIEYYLRNAGKAVDLSEAFLYYVSREKNGTEDKDSGVSVNAALDALREIGVCVEELCPYNERVYNEHPSDEAYKDAESRRTKSSQRVCNDITAVKSALSDGHPIVGTFRVFKSLEKNSDGFVKMPTNEELTEKEEYHAMVICGYNDSGKYFIVRNSWGEYFGDKGYCYLPYAYVRDAQLTRSMFIVNMGLPSERLNKDEMKSLISSHHDTPWFNYELNLNLLREEQLALNDDRNRLTQNIDKLKSVLESILNDDIEDVILQDLMQRKEAMVMEEEQLNFQLEHLKTQNPVKLWYKLVSGFIFVSGLASGIAWYFLRETWQIIVGIVMSVIAIILFAFTISNSKRQKALTTKLEELRSDIQSIDKEISDKNNTFVMLRQILTMVNEYDSRINDWRQYINESSDKLNRWKNIFDVLHNTDGLTNQTPDVDENLLEDMIHIVFNDEDEPLSDKFKQLQEKILRKLNGLYDSQISDHLNPNLKTEWKDYVETIARLCTSAELNAGPSESLMTILTDLIDCNSLEDITVPNNVILYSNKLLTFAVLEKEINIGQIKRISL